MEVLIFIAMGCAPSELQKKFKACWREFVCWSDVDQGIHKRIASVLLGKGGLCRCLKSFAYLWMKRSKKLQY